MTDTRKGQPTDRELKAAVIIGEIAELDPKSDFPSELAFQAEELGLLDAGANQVKDRLHHMVTQAGGRYTVEQAQFIADAMVKALEDGSAEADDETPPQQNAKLPDFQYQALVEKPDLSRLFQYVPQSDIEWRQGASSDRGETPKVQMLPYVDARAVMRILNETFGLLGWRAEYTEVKGGFLCRLWVFYDGDWHFKEDGAGETNIESVKGGVSGSLKRAAAAWGIAQYLYYTDSVWVPGIKTNQGIRPDWKAARPMLVVKINGEKVGE